MVANQIKKVVLAETTKVSETEEINKKEIIIKVNDFL
jgi:isochorismate synthase EntC